MSSRVDLSPAVLPGPLAAGDWEALTSAILECVPTAAFVTDRDGHLATANRNFHFVFGQRTPPVEGMLLGEFLDAPFAEFFRTLLEDTVNAGAGRERPLPEFRGELQSARYIVSTELSGERGNEAVVFVLRDVSAGLQLSALREQERVKNYLLSTMFHDLRSPLSAILNATEILPDLMDESSAESCRELLAAIDTSGSRIQQLVDDTSEYFKLRFPVRAEHRATIDLAEVLTSLVGLYQTQGHSQRFSLDVRGPAIVCGERSRLTRAFDNLLSNAVKYAPGTGEIRVRVESDEDGQCWVRIADQGPGIPEQFLSKIWDPFYRVPNTKREGTGLGLSITRHIVEEQRGTVAVDTRPGEGTTFIISLPSCPR